MIALKPATVEEIKARWARVKRPPKEPAAPAPRPLNLAHILDIGNVVFFTFRGRAYGIPPLAWRDGEQLLDAWLEIRDIGPLDDRAKLGPYYAAFRRLQKLLWKSCHPVGKIRRLLHLLRLMPNPFRKATEGEVAELVLFILGRRTTLSGQRPTAAASLNLGTS